MNRKQRKAVAKLQQKPNVMTPEKAFAAALEAHQAGRIAEAETLYRQVLAVAPQHAPSNSNLAVILRQQGRAEEAIVHYRKALETKPHEAGTCYNLGIALRELGRFEEAAACYRQALRNDPSYVNAYTNLGDVLKSLGRLPEAIAVLKEGLARDPGHIQGNFNMAVCLKDEGHNAPAQEHFQRALSADPTFFPARLGRCIASLPIIYADEEEIRRCRAAYAADLADMVATVRLESPAAVMRASDAVGLLQPFYLSYQGACDRDLQKLYGALIHRLMSARYPAWAGRPPMPPIGADGKIRVGILSGYFRHHSNWKIPIRGWLENLDRSRFQMFGYHTDRMRDDQTTIAESLCHRFVQGPLAVEHWAQTIRADNLHVLLIPEIGMDPTTVKLASLWLAPVQINSWGHPETSGSPTLDYYLSSDLMEPPDGDQHYSEKLIRLPNLSIHYTPVPPPPCPLTRADIGVRDDAIVYWCCQSLFKYLPRHDFIFARIAGEVPNSQFVFIRYGKGQQVNTVFENRLRAAFAAQGVPYEGRCVFLPPMDYARFNAATRLADVFLDSLGWSGCNTTLEALAHNIPVLTLPGTLMRGRHSYAILMQIGLTETIARDEEDYIAIAARLAREPEWRARLAAFIAANRQRAYFDTACVRGLEQALEQMVCAPATTMNTPSP